MSESGGGGGGMVNILWDMVYFFFRVSWNYLLPALFYICRKCIFWISLVQLSIHSVALYQFVRGAFKHLPSRTTYTRSSRRHPELLQAARPFAEPQFQVNITPEGRKKKRRRARKDDHPVTSSPTYLDPPQNLSDRKLSRTLTALTHRKNYASTRNYWNSKDKFGPKITSESDQTSQEESMGNSSLFGNQQRSFSTSSAVRDENGGGRGYSGYSFNSASSESFIIVDQKDDSPLTSDQEFVRAFENSDGSSDEEIIQVSVNNNNNINSSSTDSVDFSGAAKEFFRIAESSNFMETLDEFTAFIERIGIYPGHVNDFFPPLRDFVKKEIPFRFDELLDKLESRRNRPDYKNGSIGRGKKVLVIGAGPCGLRLAMEAHLLGAETTVIEARDTIDRNNILKLWSFVMDDLRSMGAKKLCPSLGIGSVNHISIKTLQFVLLKVCLILGVRIKPRRSFTAILEPSISSSWPVLSSVVEDTGEQVEEEEEFDVVIGATGRRVTLNGFDRQSLDAKMAIAITANFRNYNTKEEKHVQEIPGLSKQYDLEFFRRLEEERGIKLENIVYYQGSTHYFVMTAKKESLLQRGVIKQDLVDRWELLRQDNIDRHQLEIYAREAAEFSTGHFSRPLPRNPFALWKGKNDVSIFDFTNLYRSQNACRIIQRRGINLLTGLVGDSLLEPFWPEGTGIGQGFLGVLDTAWMMRRYFEGADLYEVIREREKLYSLLRQTGQSGLKKSFEKWSLDPRSRYNTTSFHFNQSKIYQLLDTDQPSSSEDFIETVTQVDSTPPGVRLRKKKHPRNSKNRETMFIGDLNM